MAQNGPIYATYTKTIQFGILFTIGVDKNFLTYKSYRIAYKLIMYGIFMYKAETNAILPNKMTAIAKIK